MSRLPSSGDFRAFQAAFAARVRDPRGQPRLQGVPAQRMRVYEDLLFSNLEGFLLACFPITRNLVGAREWHAMVRRFFVEHRCLSPLFREIPGEFLAWIEPLAATLFPDRPYLYEFMHYEWLELAVSVCPDEEVTADVDPAGDLLAGQPVLNHTAQLACYHYPVHRIGAGFEPAGSDGQMYCYLVYRDCDDTVQFVSLNPVSARLLAILEDGGATGREAATQVAGELGQAAPHAVVEAGQTLLEQLRLAGAVLGTQRMT